MKWIILLVLLAFPLRRWALRNWYMVIPALIGLYVADTMLKMVHLPSNLWLAKLAAYLLIVDAFAKLGKEWHDEYRE